jgi:hypothetical protein
MKKSMGEACCSARRAWTINVIGKRQMAKPYPNFQREVPIMKKGDRLVIVGMGGVGGPAAMLAKRLMPEVDVTVIREEERFIVR